MMDSVQFQKKQREQTKQQLLSHKNIFSVPKYPVVAGCNQYQYCSLEAEEEGSITCSVTGIRPLVHIEVGTFNEDDASSIDFNDRDIAVNNNGDVFDIRITLKYRMKETFRERLTLECRISATNPDVLKLTTKFDLLFTIEQPSQQVRKSGLLWILVLFIPLSLSVALITRYTILRGRRRERKTKIPEIAGENEGVQMFSVPLSEQTIEDARSIFLKQLKGKYADLYNAVQPIPYIRDRLFCVDRVFVEGGLEVLVSGNAAVSDRTWETLNCYHDVLSNPRLKSSRKILEGEPGYGKSTLTLQFAFDWCNRTSKSPIKDVEILILLRLRQFGGVKSIYRAIRQFILPRDSLLTEADIENIICSTPSPMTSSTVYERVS
ncbi:hypothetical protein HOLleu_17371 [Holothuria leucospilota]|uniref:NACHT domain-containing protein n=1 Tax=Holothuria leucospilota TaxID=206669 RepID=A0A9Q1HBQ0_HOLLE|nr:hypothetical protein HOLleu_17371 [Holothuria leucospilota]